MLKVNLRELEKRDLALTGELPAADLGLYAAPGETYAPVAYDLHVSRVGGGVLVRGRAATALRGPCSRCLADFDLRLAAPEVCHFYEQPAGDELDLAPDLREDLLIDLPVKHLCREDCRGLCPVCGGDRNRRKCRCKGTAPGEALVGLDFPTT
jgi:uncharacterized protein